MIQIENLSKAYAAPGGGEVGALRNVTLRVDDGEFLAVTGASGCGKSTLLFTLGGLCAPTGGDVRFAGRPLYDLLPSERAALRLTEIGFVFQTFNLVPYLSCEDNVMLPALLAGKAKAAARGASQAILERLGLADRRGHLPGQLSVGERQRVAVARALVNGPRLVLADEPTGNLDPVSAESVLELFRELNDAGQTIVFVTHDPRMALRARRVVRLRAGELELVVPRAAQALAS
jgi:putative ABC transport system ATP-binding protein